ncbi:response regulator [Candidatus Nitrospira allomarina]|jgi:two-component system, chemotaxis family, chemotaxis protein CheY|uniref:Response regulator n=1 Tax=Candidatus Nitrospira allomarina TaxID=3020900 RepID=A0AA96JYB2_9BACT|nr:response regulator [Candidatus Nitrospira allomarina]WNM60016.1 response regulator [Candidatus Nitrospira allomarina]
MPYRIGNTWDVHRDPGTEAHLDGNFQKKKYSLMTVCRVGRHFIGRKTEIRDVRRQAMSNGLLVDIFNRDRSVMTKEIRHQKGSAGKTILIVDDDTDFRILLRDRLVRIGMTCVEAGNGEEAKVQLQKRDVDMVVTDFRMPKMDGLALIDWLHQTHRYVPIIFVSGDVSVGIRKKAEQAGVYAILEKPCSLSDLATKVKEVVNNI